MRGCCDRDERVERARSDIFDWPVPCCCSSLKSIGGMHRDGIIASASIRVRKDARVLSLSQRRISITLVG
jgi:hypothetical protein